MPAVNHRAVNAIRLDALHPEIHHGIEYPPLQGSTVNGSHFFRDQQKGHVIVLPVCLETDDAQHAPITFHRMLHKAIVVQNPSHIGNIAMLIRL